MSKAGYAAILLIIAAAGCVALTMLFPRFDPSSRWELTLDRSQSIGGNPWCEPIPCQWSREGHW